MKKQALYALATIAMVSCSDDEYLGQSALDRPQSNAEARSILFGAGSDKVTRATSGLETETGTFKVYGTKGTGDLQVFNNYAVWHAQQKEQTLTDTYYWDYVGQNGDEKTPYLGDESGALVAGTNITLDRNQQEKYWDYEQPYYRFWAVAPWDGSVTFYNGDDATAVNTDGIVTKAVLTNVSGHLNAATAAADVKTYYVAQPLKVERADYDKPVTFTFVRNAAKVRVGIYEEIPGYRISDITFYQTRISTSGRVLKVDGTDADGNVVTGRKNIILNRTDKAFVGNVGATPGTTIIDYDNTNLTYAVSYDNVVSQKYFEAGKMTGVPATSSTDPGLWGTDPDMDARKFFQVMPTPTAKGRYGDPYADAARPIYVCCDFTLESTDGNTKEKIYVKGATAVIPASYTTWLPNHAYTYLFKIARNTNGTTGNWDPTGPVDPEDPNHPDPDVPNSTDPSDPGDGDPTTPDVPGSTPDNPDPGNNPDDPVTPPTDPSDPGYDPDLDPDDSPQGLYTITFDAVVEEYLDGNLEGTTTTFTTPSITTYQNGVDVVDEGLIYKVGEDITYAVMANSEEVTNTYKCYLSQCLADYNYNKTPEQNGATFTLDTAHKIVAPSAGWYVIKVVHPTDSTISAYKVVRVGAADSLSD